METHIDYRAILEKAHVGIRRGIVFMGLGVNAADSDTLTEHRLINHTRVDLIGVDVTPQILSEWKNEFRSWVVACAFKEVNEALCLFFDSLYKASALVARTFDERKQRKFEHLGLDKKIEAIRADFGFHHLSGTHIASIYKARNALVHRFGEVSEADCDANGELVITYLFFTSVFTPIGGTTYDIPDIFTPGNPAFEAKEEGHLGIQFRDFSLRFKRGERIVLEPKELTGILYTAMACTGQYMHLAQEYALSKGVPVLPAPLDYIKKTSGTPE